MKFAALIVDDERLSRSYISNMISTFAPDIHVSEVSSAKEALSFIENNIVDILFLDIQMPDINGFELLRQLNEREFELIFITAYSQYAIKAIKEGAVDYLLKPIKKIEFKETLDKIIARLNSRVVQSLPSSHNYLEEKKIEVLEKLQKATILTDEEWLIFRNDFEVLHKSFFTRLREKFPELSQAEVRLFALIKLNLSTKEMAGMLGISPETIRQTKWRMRKKFNVPESLTLEEMISDF